MIDELQGIWKEAILSWNLPGGTEEKLESPQSV
jgi:hypothetical protein